MSTLFAIIIIFCAGFYMGSHWGYTRVMHDVKDYDTELDEIIDQNIEALKKRLGISV